MANKLETFDVDKWTVFGRNTFLPPFKITDALINEARIVYVVKGKSRLYSAEQYTDLTNGDLLIMKTDNFINHWQENEDGSHTQVIVFQLTADFLKFLYQNRPPSWFSDTEIPAGSSVVKVNPHPILSSYFEQFKFYLEEPSQLTEEVIQIKIRELISILVQTDQDGAIRQIMGNLFTATDYAFQEVISKNLYEDLNLEDLAFFTGMSLSSFKRKFSSVYGTTPNKYIISKRLEKAQTLLTTSNLSIAEIAYDCGFSEIGYFSKTFRKYYNVSPSDFRK
ncbi:helix-turn-helix transcriptional regulator [bacterium SCSIO 12741]|nr:helix-turn-helix transcriptional regulator [bacterium SCSIO 12741]